MSKKKLSSRPDSSAGGGVVKEKLSALEAQERKLREEMEALQRKVADSPRQLAEARRREEEREAAERKARSEAEKDAVFFDQTRTSAGRSSGPRRAVKLKVEQKTMKQETWVLVIFLLIVVFMLWSALT